MREREPLLAYAAATLDDGEQHFADCEIIVIGDNHCWGKGEALDEAKRNASSPKRWIAFIAKKGTEVSEFDGSLIWQTGFAPREIARHGIPYRKAH